MNIVETEKHFAIKKKKKIQTLRKNEGSVTKSKLYNSPNHSRLCDRSALKFELSGTCPNLKDLSKYTKLN